jgi:acyl carrier protein phosphodiesterase
VNFFGHAAIASWQTDFTPGVALGAMLPDFANMCGARLAGARDPDITRGIDLHHKTDAAFHTAPVVTGLMRELYDAVTARGCARGPARATSHIGMELLLDGALLDDAGFRDAYERALAPDLAEAGGVAWREADGDARFARLLARLRAYGVPEDLRAAASVAHRLARMLADRPLLAPSPADLAAMTAALDAFAARITVAAPSVMRAMRAALA